VPNYAKVFSDRPDIMDLWAELLTGIRRHIEPRRFELVTFAAALELGSSYCALAHGQVLGSRFLSPAQMRALAEGDTRSLSDAEVAMMALARKVIRDSSSVTSEDIERLRRSGLDENEIFDVVVTAAARAFFAKLVDALGAEPDSSFMGLEDALRERLTVGRPIASQPTERMDDEQP
jgi:alkylhydroperoxidase family enzyme